MTNQERVESLKYYGTGDEGVELFQHTCALAYHMSGIGDHDKKIETLIEWAEEMANHSKEWANEDDLDDFEYGVWGGY